MNEHEDLARLSKAHRLAAVIDSMNLTVEDLDNVPAAGESSFWEGVEFLAATYPAGRRTKQMVRDILVDLAASRARVAEAMADPFDGLPS